MTSAEDHPTTEGKKESKDSPDSYASGEASNTAADAVPATSNESATKDDDERPSDAAQPSAKKRRSNIQLNKDDHPEGHTCNSDDDGDLNEEGGNRSDPFKRAPEDVIKKRKIVKASGKWGSGGNGGSNGGGAFASVKLATDTDTEKTEKDTVTSVFGSSAKVPAFGSTTGSTGFGAAAKTGGFGSGFGAVSSGFGAFKPTSSTDKADSNNVDATSSSSKSTGFGGGFGAVSTGFGSLKSSTTSFSFGAAPNVNAAPSPNNAAATSNISGLAGTFAKSPGKSSNASPSKFPTSSVVDTANGEQDEDCLCQIRAKLFKMLPEDEAAGSPEDSSASKGDVLSVPSTAGRMKFAKAKVEDEDGSNEAPEKANEPATAGGEDDKKQKLVQKEAGIGPVRILKRKPPILPGGEEEAAKESPTARVVQRQETSGGIGTKVILNVRLIPKTCNVIRRGDKFVQLNAPNSDGTLETSLFMVKLASEADTLEENLRAILDVPGEDVPVTIINH